MKEANWQDCIINNSAKKNSPDVKRAESLIETAKERINLIKEINEKNCNFVFEDYYTSLFELLQALTFKKGFNILNHVCLGYYLRDILKREELYRIFDDIRYKRNSLTYYGKKMDFETAKDTIERCKKFFKIIEEELK
ncbi:HEPN domain-containing protein [Candidatus Pacearchaeota archaeon]|nr:HEPN domain-containing protein [Candidatus Pacearchaeota archaeon]